MIKRIAVIGSTGSIGTSCLNIVRNNLTRYQIVALAAGENVAALESQIEEFKPQYYFLASGAVCRGAAAVSSIAEICALSCVDAVLFASSGFTSCDGVLTAIAHGKQVLLANKETLVCAGEIIMREAKKKGMEIIPVDSEHSAVWQSIGSSRAYLNRIILTASGGAFRDTDRDKLFYMRAEDALRHPNWNMGKKITVDSASLMNKGLEVIEAHFLFDVPYCKIECVLHRESIVHSMVEFTDGAVIAELSYPSMEIPISLALSYPERIPTSVPPLDFTKQSKLSFEPIDEEKFPCFRLARQVACSGGIMPTVMNAANEVAVAKFLSGEICFGQIFEMVEKTVSGYRNILDPTLLDIFEADADARHITKQTTVK